MLFVRASCKFCPDWIRISFMLHLLDCSITLQLVECSAEPYRRVPPWPSHNTIPLFPSLHALIATMEVRGASMGPTWGRQDPGGPHVGPMNLATMICDVSQPVSASTKINHTNIHAYFLNFDEHIPVYAQTNFSSSQSQTPPAIILSRTRPELGWIHSRLPLFLLSFSCLHRPAPLLV